MPRVYSSLLLSLLIGGSASAVTIDWTYVDNPGNACDPQSGSNGAPAGCFGSVGYAYNIGTYEVTNAQYAEFLNAKAASDPLGLYSSFMSDVSGNYGGITRSGTSGSYSYSAIAGREAMPVNHVSFYDSIRFANWMSNGQGVGDTETGSYTLLGGTATPSNGATVTRNAGATIVLTSGDEWYKAAYYDALSSGYFDYAAAFNSETACATPTATPNSANCDFAVDDLTPVGSYTSAASPYGTFDQGGNVNEWNELNLYSGSYRGVRGGPFDNVPESLAASTQFIDTPGNEHHNLGFRLAMIPEPGTGLLVVAGLLGIAARRRARDRQSAPC